MSNNYLISIRYVEKLIKANEYANARKIIYSWQPEDLINDVVNSMPPLICLGVKMAKSKLFEDAIYIFELGLKVDPNNLIMLYNLGLVNALLGKHDRAIDCYDSALKLEPANNDLLINKAASLNDLLKHQEALLILEGPVLRSSNLEAVLIGRAIALAGMGKFKESLDKFDHVLMANIRNVEAHVRRALILDGMGLTQEAILSYERALIFDPHCIEALSNLGGLYRQFRKFDRALGVIDLALKINPNFKNALVNRGFIFADIGMHERALEDYDKAIAIADEFSAPWVGKGFSHSALKQFDRAAIAFMRALEIDPDIEFLLGPLIHAKMQICNWENYGQLLEQLLDSLKRGVKVSPPFQILGLVEDPSLIQIAARNWILDQHPAVSTYPQLNSRIKSSGRIKLGYFSPDFREHPVSHLVAGMIEAHDRKQFEVYAFSWGPKTSDEMRRRLETGFDYFMDIDSLSDQETAELSRKEGIDIAIDLTGLTGNSRPGIFANRAAPLQINYLGYPGTMGSSFMDYLIADEVVIPKAELSYYDEKVIYLPHSFQVNDYSKVISEKTPVRSKHGLPENAFVFCCFSGSFKITPSVFSVWMRILHAIPRGVLWLAIENEITRENLEREAISYGVASNRLIFAQRLPSLADHLARYSLADLFLDTTPYGAHTTASDALWSGLPVLTCLDRGYASRVAASLLHTLKIDELIGSDLKDYEQKAIKLAKNPTDLNLIKMKLGVQIKCSPLFNTLKFARDMEEIYLEIYDKHQIG